VPNQISSVFAAFSCIRRHAHQSCRSLIQDVRRWRCCACSPRIDVC